MFYLPTDQGRQLIRPSMACLLSNREQSLFFLTVAILLTACGSPLPFEPKPQARWLVTRR